MERKLGRGGPTHGLDVRGCPLRLESDAGSVVCRLQTRVAWRPQRKGASSPRVLKRRGIAAFRVNQRESLETRRGGRGVAMLMAAGGGRMGGRRMGGEVMARITMGSLISDPLREGSALDRGSRPESADGRCGGEGTRGGAITGPVSSDYYWQRHVPGAGL